MLTIKPNSQERLEKIRTFCQGANLYQVHEDCTKNLLALEDACKALTEAPNSEGRHGLNNSPSLTEPKRLLTGSSVGNPSASIISTLAQFRKIMSDSTIDGLSGQLKLLRAESQALRDKGDSLLKDFEDKAQKLQDRMGEIQEIIDQRNALETDLQALEQQKQALQAEDTDCSQQLANYEKELKDAQAEFAKLTGSSMTAEERLHAEELKEKIKKINSNISTLHAKAHQIEEKRIKIEQQIAHLQGTIEGLIVERDKLIDLSVAEAIDVDNARTEINTFIENSLRNAKTIDGDRFKSAIALLTMLTAQLKKTLNEDSIRSMRAQEEALSKINEASRKDAESKAKEAEEAQRKAEEASKAASCISRTIGYIMLAISVVATVATLGAATPFMMAVAAIGLAISVTDMVLDATGNSSLMQMFASVVSKVATGFLLACGVSEDDAKFYGELIGMIYAAVSFIAVSLLASFSNFAQVATKVVSTITKQITQVLPKILMRALTTFGSKAANLVKMSTMAAHRLDIILKSIMMGLSVTNGLASGGLNLHSAAKARDMKTMLAGMMVNNEAIKSIEELLKELVKWISKSNSLINDMLEGMVSTLQESGRNNANIVKNSFA